MNRAPSGKQPPTPSDEQLVAATLGGDRNSYRTLVERYQDRLLRIALEIVKNPTDAEDIVQESFVKAFLSLDKFKGNSSFFTWLYRITFNMAVDFKRRAQRRGGSHFEYKEHLSVSTDVRGGDTNEPVTEQTTLSQNVEGPHEALVRKEAGRKIDQVFAQLSDEHRAVITLREVDGLDYEEIASILGVPRGTVMSRLFYARKALQRALREFAPDSISGTGADHPDQEINNTAAESDSESDQRTPLIKRVK
jgi:RNA polymerase sigma-70 factor (ECF subfamily)